MTTPQLNFPRRSNTARVSERGFAIHTILEPLAWVALLVLELEVVYWSVMS